MKTNKKFQYGAASTLFTIIFIVGAVLINVIASLVASAVNMNIDLTPNDIYAVSDDTYQLLDTIDEEVTIYVFKAESAMDDIAIQYLKQYDLYSDNISLKVADININPAFASKYGVSSADDILFVSERRSKIVDVNDIYYENSYTGASGVCAEYRFSAAIKFVTAKEIPTMAVITGHGELSDDKKQFASVYSLAEDNCYNVITVDLRYNDIPEDVTYINIIGPAKDYTIEEIDKLDLFLTRKTENAYTIAVYLLYSAPDMPNLSAFLKEWGITPNYNMVLETANYMNDTPYLVTAEKGSSTLTETINGTIITPTTVYLETEYRTNYVITPILTSTKNAYAKDITKVNFDDPADISLGEGDKAGRFTTGVISTTAESAGDRVVDYNVIVFGSPYVVYEQYAASASFDNDALLVACYETSITDETSFYVSPKYYIDSTLSIDNTEKTGYIVLLGAVAAMLIAASVVVYIRRKNK